MGTQEFSHDLCNQLRILIDTEILIPSALKIAAQFQSKHHPITTCHQLQAGIKT